MKALQQLRLPQSLVNNKTANTIKSYVSLLGPKSSYFSVILYGKNNKYHFIQKDSNFPFIKFDWTMYSLMRANARTVVTSGVLLRRQHNIYNETLGNYGSQDIIEIYKQNKRQELVNLIVYTKSMSHQQINHMINKNYFKIVPYESLAASNFKELAQKINEKELGPTIYECGQKTLGASMLQVKQSQLNFVEMIIVSLFQGALPEKYVADQYCFKVINRDFDKVWESESVASVAKHQNGEQKPISLKFIVYIRKDKRKVTKQ